MQRALGWQPDAPDARDDAFSIGAILIEFDAAPEAASNRDLVRGMFDQLNIGSCVGNCFSRADHMLEVAAFNDGKIAKIPEPSSRLFHHYNSRFQTGDHKRETGTFIRLCVRQANELGVPPESIWPYTPHQDVNGEPMWAVKPAMKAFQYASADRARMYRRIASDGDARIDEVKRCVADGMPIIFGTYVAKSFTESKGPIVIGPPGLEAIAGGHAMVIVGYDAEGVWICNSWGTGWREGGFAKLKWEYIVWPGTRDLWALS